MQSKIRHSVGSVYLQFDLPATVSAAFRVKRGGTPLTAWSECMTLRRWAVEEPQQRTTDGKPELNGAAHLPV